MLTDQVAVSAVTGILAGSNDRMITRVEATKASSKLFKRSDLPYSFEELQSVENYNQQEVPAYDYFQSSASPSYARMQDLKHDIELIESMPGFLSRMVGLMGQAASYSLRTEEDHQTNKEVLEETLGDPVPESQGDDLFDAKANRLRVEYLLYESAQAKAGTRRGSSARSSETSNAREAADRLLLLRKRYHELKAELNQLERQMA